MNRYKIYIPSKGRAFNCLTADLLADENIDFFIVVEPQDYENYISKYSTEKVLKMNENNMGLDYARNFSKDHATKMGWDYHWQMDDDIKQFYRRINGKRKKVSALENINEIEKLALQNQFIGLIGMRLDAYAFAYKIEFSQNQQIPGCLLINNKIQQRWRNDVVEDTDFSLQVLFAGWSTILANRITFDVKPSNTQSGGCTEIYWQRAEIKYARQAKLQEYYPGYFEIEQKNGTTRVKPSRIWRQFQQRNIVSND